MELKEIIQNIDELKHELDALRPIPEEAMHRYMQKIRLDWNYHSNSIEGNTLSFSETKSLILYGITASNKPIRDHIEMQGHNKALHRLEEIVHKDINITENTIKEFHELILVEPYDSEAEINPGKYKTSSNYLYTKTGERIDFEPPEEVPRLMNELINWLNNHISPPKRKRHKYDLHPLLIAAGFHTQFIQIHPFGDGNGRTARIIMNLILMLTGYVPAIIKLDDRDIYYHALNESSQTEPEPLAVFIGDQLIESLKLMVKAAKGESIEEPDDLDKRLALLQKEIDAEDKENEIKETLDEKTYRNAMNNWGCDLLYDLARISLKFNPFYSRPTHTINFMVNGSDDEIKIDERFTIEKIKRKFSGAYIIQKLSAAKTILQVDFGPYIKGGTNPFGCNYRFVIKFEEYHYTIQVPQYKGLNQYEYVEKQKLLHQPLTQAEMDEINTIWGETLLQHLNANRAELKNNK